MTILLPYEVSQNNENGNNYLWYFYKSLKEQNLDIISSQKEWLKESIKFDAVFIHWPEYLPLFDIKSKNEFVRFSIERVKFFKNTSKIFYFVHNKEPYFDKKNNLSPLFEYIIYNSSAIFHFSDFSKELFIEKYKNINVQFVVPHGNYRELIKERFDNKFFLKNLKLNPANITVSTIGAIRNKKEFEILRGFAKNFLNKNCNFIYVGDITSDYSSIFYDNVFSYLLRVIFIKFKLLNLIKYHRSFKLRRLGNNIYIDPKNTNQFNLANICNSSDILLICKSENINSGNIALGFTFGCVVLGPNIGNIGEILRNYKNITYEVNNLDYEKVVELTINSLNKNIDSTNLEVSELKWNWDNIAKQYINKIRDFNVL